MNPNSDTPRTDEKQFRMISEAQSGYRYVVSVDFARQLERELNEANRIAKSEFDRATDFEKELLKVSGKLDQWQQCAEELAERLKLIVEYHHGTPLAESAKPLLAHFNKLKGKP